MLLTETGKFEVVEVLSDSDNLEFMEKKQEFQNWRLKNE